MKTEMQCSNENCEKFIARLNVVAFESGLTVPEVLGCMDIFAGILRVKTLKVIMSTQDKDKVSEIAKEEETK